MAKGTRRTRRPVAVREMADPRERVIDAFMALVAERGPYDIALTDIADRAAVTLAELRGLYPGKGAILADFAKRIDREVLAGGTSAGTDQTTHDRLFDVAMRRFDALAPYKEAIRRTARAARTDPALALVLHRLARRAQRWTFAAANVRQSGPLGLVAGEGMVLVYAETMRAWLDDDSDDLARTMAALDRSLRRGERAMRFLSGACSSAARLAGRFRRSRPVEG